MLRRQSGQATIFMALFMGTMILLFAFTTNIGMLVHAKINLQNAADAAAYAGAAVQARQLTNAAYLNWEMRRALKEFLFLYMVRGSYAQSCFPRDSNGSPGNDSSRAGCIDAMAQYVGPGTGNQRYPFVMLDPGVDADRETPDRLIPTVCILFEANNNYCQKGGVPGIAQVPGGSFGVADPIVQSVHRAVQDITRKKELDCQDRSDLNNLFLWAWLFNLEVAQKTIAAANAGESDVPFDVSGMDGLGVLPRMALLRARIDNIEDSLNLNLRTEGFSSAGVDDSLLSELQARANGASTGLLYYERPIQAFLSAKNNLPSTGNNGIFSEITLNELIPSSAGNVPLNPERIDQNPPVLVKFNDLRTTAYFATSQFRTASGVTGGAQTEGQCNQFRYVTAVSSFPLGIAKDPNVITYYAVQLQAKVRLLFSPFGGGAGVTISAYSAAKPFGSRIGRDLSKDTFGMIMAPVGLGREGIPVGGNGGPILPPTAIVNVPVTDEASDRAELGGFSRNDHLGYLRASMEKTGNRYYGFRLAGAYAPWEVGFYTPPANYMTPSRIGAFPDNPTFDDPNKDYRYDLTAPVIPFKNPTASLSFIDQKIKMFLQSNSVNDGTDRFPDLSAAGMPLNPAKYDQLFTFMQNENQLDFHRIPDPLLNDVPALLSFAKSDPNGSKFTVAAMPEAQKRQLTSWNNYKTAADTDASLSTPNELNVGMGRSGYSVRFISFSSLMSGGQTVRGDPNLLSDAFSDPFQRLDAGGANARIMDDITKIKH